jgi:alkylation response protein AidB-like acyl-CoA dehydrogenase
LPHCEPYWYNGRYRSPFYDETHIRFRARVREFCDKELVPFVPQWDEAGDHPEELRQKAYDAGLLAALWPTALGGTPPEGVERANAFHDLILVDELSRAGGGGILWSVFFSFGIALPPVLNFGSQYLIDLCARDIITGKAVMALAVSEPYAGSDVAGLQTTAVRDGDHFIVNGTKKFITSGCKARWLTTAVRTGGKGHGGVSLLLVDTRAPGVQLTRMKTQGWWTSNTALVAFNDVRVPVTHLIGNEGEGFKYIVSARRLLAAQPCTDTYVCHRARMCAQMLNFNHERFVLSAMSNRYARCCMEDAVSYAQKRRTFEKRLADHQVIRHKVAEMSRAVESTHALLEQIAYQMKAGVPDKELSGLIGLAKVQATRTYEFCAREASQILGGNSCIRGGPGERVERLYREVRINAIGGGSEEILLDMAMRQAKL